MTILDIKVFMGLSPRYGDRKISPNQATQALNVDLFSRELRPVRSNLQVNSPTKSGTVKTIYPLNDKWLHWIDDVNVVPAPLQTEQDGRIYYTGDKNPKATDNVLSVAGSSTDYPTTFYRLGLSTPETAPSVGVTGGSSGIPESRDYIYTFVTAWGEEGPPSSPTTYIAANDDATSWDISSMDTAPLNNGVITNAVHSAGVVTVTLSANTFLETGDYVDHAAVVGMTDLNGSFQITRISSTSYSVILTTAQTYTSGGTWTREAPIQTSGMTLNLYRTVNGVYKLVASGITLSTYTDTITDANTQDAIKSTYYTSPNGDLKGLIDLPNGALAGFYKNVLAFSEPYQPHAWPSSYEITFPYDIVAIASKGNSVFVATKRYPYLVTGYHPDSMSDRNLEFNQACISKRSMQTVLNGVIYASPDGLAFIPIGGAPYLITKSWMKKNDWDLYNPASIDGYVYDDRYYAAYSGGGINNNESGVFVFDPEEQESTITVLDVVPTAGYTDLELDNLYFMESSAITLRGSGGSHKTYTWRSKVFTTARPVCLKAAKVKLTFGSGVAEGDKQVAIDSVMTAMQNDIDNGVIGDSGSFAGSSPATYPVSSGPFMAAGESISNSVITATLRVYANGVLYAEKLLSSTNRAFSLPLVNRPSLHDTWEVEITGTDVQVHEVSLAENKSEFKNV